MDPFSVASVLYTILLALGGIMGFVSKGSMASLAAGLASAGLLAALEFGMSSASASWLQCTVSTLLLGVMAKRFLGSEKFMPAGLVAMLSGALVVAYALRALTLRKVHAA